MSNGLANLTFDLTVSLPCLEVLRSLRSPFVLPTIPTIAHVPAPHSFPFAAAMLQPGDCGSESGGLSVILIVEPERHGALEVLAAGRLGAPCGLGTVRGCRT